MDEKTRRLLDLIEQQGNELHRLLVRLTLRYDVAEDLLQELFLKLQRSDSFEAADSPASYAKRAAIHLAFDWRRKQRVAAVSLGSLDREPAAGTDCPSEPLSLHDEVRQILQLLEQLPEIYSECVILRYLDEESYATIAKQVGKTDHQVRAICSKAIQQLRELMPVERAVRGRRGGGVTGEP